METSKSLSWAAVAAGLGVAVTAALLFHHGSLLGALAVVPLAAGLGGLSRERTWGGFATLGGAVLVGAAASVGVLPAWAGLAGLAGVAVAIPALYKAFRYDATAASVWVALAALGGTGTALAWSELEALQTQGGLPEVSAPRIVYKPVLQPPEAPGSRCCDGRAPAPRVWAARVEVDLRDGRSRHRPVWAGRQRHRPHPHRGSW